VTHALACECIEWDSAPSGTSGKDIRAFANFVLAHLI
jgi:hypothetical protein